MSMISLCYFGGLYFNNPYYETFNTIQIYRNFALVGIGPEKNEALLECIHDMAQESDSGIGYVLNVGYFHDMNLRNYVSLQNLANTQGVIYKSLIGVSGCIPTPVFLTSEDFITFNKVIGIMPQDFVLNDAEIIMSDILKRNVNMEIGDMVDNDGNKVIGFKQKSRLAGTYDSAGYTSFRVDSKHFPDSVMLIRKLSVDNETDLDKEVSITRFNDDMARLKQQYPDLIFIDANYHTRNIARAYSVYRTITVAVSFVVALVLAITINATLIGEYDNRRFEFNYYNAVGLSFREIAMKIAKEILLINLVGLMLGIIVVFLITFVLNETILYNNGIHMAYYCTDSVLGAGLCEVGVVVPVIAFQINRIGTQDVTDWV